MTTYSRFVSLSSATEPQHTRSEATRLLCAGVYFDGEFRQRVIEQLVEHEERPVAPSLGIDALQVLAHAIRSRRQEAQAALYLLVIWAGFIVFGLFGIGSEEVLLPVPWFAAYMVVCVMSWAAQGGPIAIFVLGRSVIKEATRGRLKRVLPLVPFLVTVAYWALAVFALFRGADAWAALVFPALLVLPVQAYRAQVVSVMRRSLSRTAHATEPRAKLPDSAQYQRIGAAIDREQHAGMVIYDPFKPFVGAGEPYKPWSVVTELRSKAGQPPQPEALTAREVIDLIRPRLEALATSAAATSRDRLRSIEIDEVVYMPVGLSRSQLEFQPAQIRQQVNGAVGEGGEARRHFLRIRVGAWDERIGLSLLVRVHTQGGMLVLEVVPHVLAPVRHEFSSVDVVAARGTGGLLRQAVSGLFVSPAANPAAGVSLILTTVSLLRVWLTMPHRAPLDAPAASVRELGSVSDLSLFQEMDISRYVRTLQDRIASGVEDALRQKGYETGEFQQYIINVSGGGVFIGGMSGGAVAMGKWASARHVSATEMKGNMP
ncbi:hypothetical protein E6W39_38645 [Kitasatospora acidiphila]|uniref:Uncharacterized protein n=1 Tax=Kitasatospora acidiphila TaxID=2567942 RepID=A0A540WDQ1_9ACTN|nr:hypothetical protein [Kitasatospora acidiphila]TQF07027.1 hypothetical protein E6W39_38645 [Kitasatospora acidiphila]